MTHPMKIGVAGAGAWGTALAITSNHAGCDVLLWARKSEIAEEINSTQKNSNYLPNIKLDKKIRATSSLIDIIDCNALIITVPAQTLRDFCISLKNNGIKNNVALIICCKGIEQVTHYLMSEIVAEILPHNPVAILSGPNFASEIASGLPAAATLACKEQQIGMQLVTALGSKLFRIYYSPDITGAQVGGAVKNVLAIACGIAIGRGLGENARAALVTRGVAEISRLCVAKGGAVETLMGLSGLGDIMLTCGSLTSRNMALGAELGKGRKASEILKATDKITEGVATAQSVVELADILKIDMPICRAVNNIIYNDADVDKTVNELLGRPLTAENTL